MGGGAAILLGLVLLTTTVVVVVSLVKRSGRRRRAALAGLPESAEDVSRSALRANGLALAIVGAVLCAGLTLALAFGDGRRALISLVLLCVLLLLPGVVLLTPLPRRLTLQHQRRLLIGLTVYDGVLAALASMSIVLAIVFLAVAVKTGKAARRLKASANTTPATSSTDDETPPVLSQLTEATSTFEQPPPSESDSLRVQSSHAHAATRRGVVGFALALVGFIMPVVWPIGLALSWRDIRREKRERQAHGLSLAGLIVSAVGTTAVAVVLVVFLAGAQIPLLSNLRDTPKNSAVKEDIQTIQGGIEAWAADHEGKYPPASEVSRMGAIIAYVDEWPDNPYTRMPMTRGRRPGNFQYRRVWRYATWDDWFDSVTEPATGSPPREEPRKVPSYSLTGYGRDGKVIIEVP